MTRQPALEKRLTVAWPMPRLAPVRSRVRRGSLMCVVGMVDITAFSSGVDPGWHQENATKKKISRIEPRLGPRRVEPLAPELDAVMQPKRPVLPELHDHGHDPVAAPVRRTGHG